MNRGAITRNLNRRQNGHYIVKDGRPVSTWLLRPASLCISMSGSRRSASGSTRTEGPAQASGGALGSSAHARGKRRPRVFASPDPIELISGTEEHYEAARMRWAKAAGLSVHDGRKAIEAILPDVGAALKEAPPCCVARSSQRDLDGVGVI